VSTSRIRPFSSLISNSFFPGVSDFSNTEFDRRPPRPFAVSNHQSFLRPSRKRRFKDRRGVSMCSSTIPTHLESSAFESMHRAMHFQRHQRQPATFPNQQPTSASSTTMPFGRVITGRPGSQALRSPGFSPPFSVGGLSPLVVVQARILSNE
jgi:hypothetical protein